MRKIKTFNRFMNEKLDQSEIDVLLDKINAHGIESLSEFERNELDNAHNKEYNLNQLAIIKINKIVKKYGGAISMQDLQAESSPIYKEIGQEIHLIEMLGEFAVTVVSYGGYKYETELNEYEVFYIDLTMDTLIEIERLLDNAIEFDM